MKTINRHLNLSTLQNKLQMCQSVYWIINLFVLLCVFNLIVSQPCVGNDTNPDLPDDWPCPWNNGVIPFVFDLFSVNPNRLRSLINKGHAFVEERSCLQFQEHNPVELAKTTNFTYLFYTFSGVLERCCETFYSSRIIGRRMVVITPLCTFPAEVGHTTFHGMGLTHKKNSPFPDHIAKAVMFPANCKQEMDDLTMYQRGENNKKLV